MSKSKTEKFRLETIEVEYIVNEAAPISLETTVIIYFIVQIILILILICVG